MFSRGEEVTEKSLVKGIFTLFDKTNLDKIGISKDELVGLNCDIVKINKDELLLSEIMFDGIEIKVKSYNDETGILEVDFSKSIPLWTLDDFSGWFIPKFE